MGELREVLAELWADRRRLFLVVVALAWGTLGLTVLLGFGGGFDAAMQDVMRASGDRMLRLHGGSTRLPWQGIPAGRRVPLTPRDLPVIERIPGVRRASVEHIVNGRIGRPGEIARSRRIHGVDADYGVIRGLRLAPGGRFLSPMDSDERRRVAVIGAFVADELFGRADPVGQTIVVAGQPFTVVGVLLETQRVSNYSGMDEDKTFLPASTLRSLFGVQFMSYAIVEAARPEASEQLVQVVRRTLSARMQFDPDDRGAIGIHDFAASVRQTGVIVLGTRLFLAIVGVLGLLVAAIGVGNVMHALVEERVREIGLRIALGARPAQIRARQLLEALLLVLFGGGVGFVVATAMLRGLDALPIEPEVRAYLGSPVPSWSAAAVVALLLGGSALIAGWHPARRAAMIQPVEALRHE